MEHFEETFTRGELARRTGLGVETIRYYEDRGLLPSPKRSSSNYRLYSTSTLARVEFIQRAKGLGFTLREIRELIELADDPTSDCADVLAAASRKLAALEDTIAQMQITQARLADLVARCSGKGSLECCPILADQTDSSPKENVTVTTTRTIEIFSAGCAVCAEAVQRIESMACPSCEIVVSNMSEPEVARRAQQLGVQRVPAVVVDGSLLGCCSDGIDEQQLRDAGIGQAL